MFPVEGDGSLNKFFSEINLKSFKLPDLGKVLVIESSTSIAQACRQLLRHNFLAAPVVDDSLPADTAWYEKYIGIVDFLAMVEWMVSKVDGNPPDSFEKLLDLNAAFRTTSVSELTSSARWCPFVPLEPNTNNMLDAMILLGKYAVHRVVVVTPLGDINNIITQSALIGALASNVSAPEFRPVLAKTIGEIRDKTKEVFVINQKQTFFEAFKVMATNLVSAVPIVNDAGVIVGNLSVKDLRKMLTATDQFARLNSVIGTVPDFTRAPITCTDEYTLGEVVTKLAASGVHRVYVTNKDNVVEGIISLREIVALFVKEPSDSKLGEYFCQ